MLGRLVQTHGEDVFYPVPRVTFRRWLDKVVASLLPRRSR